MTTVYHLGNNIFSTFSALCKAHFDQYGCRPTVPMCEVERNGTTHKYY